MAADASYEGSEKESSCLSSVEIEGKDNDSCRKRIRRRERFWTILYSTIGCSFGLWVVNKI
jgi:hypothetical protein